MRVGFLALIGVGAALAASTIPAVWNTKDFSAWTRRDAEQIMTNSPWSKERPLSFREKGEVTYVDPEVGASAAPTAALGNPANVTTGANVSTVPAGSAPLPAEQTGSLNSAPAGAPLIPPFVKVVWASALPVRLAVLKLRSGESGPTAEQVAKAEQDVPNYVIAVVGLAAPEAGANPKDLARAAVLSVRGKPSVVSLDSDYRRIGHSNVYFFSFAKSALPITTADKEVAFKLNAERMNVSQTFHLNEMKYRGRLAL